MSDGGGEITPGHMADELSGLVKALQCTAELLRDVEPRQAPRIEDCRGLRWEHRCSIQLERAAEAHHR